MADWKFLNVLQFSYGFKGTILDGIADKYLVFPTDEDCLKLCEKAHDILTKHYENLYKTDKESLLKAQEILKRNPKFPERIGTHYQPIVPQLPSKYDPDDKSILFRQVIWNYKALQKLEDEILEKQTMECMKKEIEEQKKLLKSQQVVDCSKCPTCKK
jgi:hypothetical protein